MNKPLISVVLPTYNGEKYLSRAVESCLDQSFSDFELIIVNDCSTDGTKSVAEGYAARDERVRLINNEVNKKLPASLNTGFRNAEGTYLTWTSDDNYYAKDAFRIMEEHLAKNEQVDIVYTNYYLIDEDGKVMEMKVLPEWRKIYRGNIAGACFLYRKEVQEKLSGYDEGLFLVEDYDFWIRASKYFRFEKVEEALYYYQSHGNSLTSQHQEMIRTMHHILLIINASELDWMLPGEKKALTGEIMQYLADENNAAAIISTANTRLEENRRTAFFNSLVKIFQDQLEEKDNKISEILTSRSYRLGNGFVRSMKFFR